MFFQRIQPNTLELTTGFVYDPIGRKIKKEEQEVKQEPPQDPLLSKISELRTGGATIEQAQEAMNRFVVDAYGDKFEFNPNLDPERMKQAEQTIEGMKGSAESIMKLLNLPADITEEQMAQSDNPIIQKLAPFAGLAVALATPMPGDDALAVSRLAKKAGEGAKKKSLQELGEEVEKELKPLREKGGDEFAGFPDKNAQNKLYGRIGAKELLVGGGIGATTLGLSLLAPLLQDKSYEKNQKAFYEGSRHAIQTSNSWNELDKIKEQYLPLVKDEEKQKELSELLERRRIDLESVEEFRKLYEKEYIPPK